jgi:transposase
MRGGEILTCEKPFSGTNRYSDSVIAFCELLFQLGVVSVNRVCQIFKSLFGISISAGTVQNFHKVCKEKVMDAITLIKEMLIASSLTHHDESGHRVNGRLKWIHVASNERLTLLSFHKKRGKEAMEEIGVINKSSGTVMTDCWSPYFTFQNVTNALCGGHLLRDLQGQWENTGQLWTLRLMSHLLRTHKKKERLTEQGVTAFTDEELDRIVAVYRRIVASGISINPLPERRPGQRGRLKRGKTRALLDRCDEHMYDYLRFAFDFRVPFTNNLAERDLRINRLKENVSGCFRTDDGADEWADVMSYLKTAAKNNVLAMDALKMALDGKAADLVRSFSDQLVVATE